MHAILLAPGPSVTLYAGPAFGSFVCAVNRAATLYPCHTWAALDLPMIRDRHRKVRGATTILSNATTRGDVGGRIPPHWGWVTTDELRTDCPRDNGWTCFSATSALVYLHALGASRIEVYGADMVGTLDWDGMAAGEQRQPDRWERERNIWGAVCSWMGETCEVIRVGA